MPLQRLRLRAKRGARRESPLLASASGSHSPFQAWQRRAAEQKRNCTVRDSSSRFRGALAAAMAEAFLEDLTCAVCLDLFAEPVVLACGHCFCQRCISSFWDSLEAVSSCPNCRAACPERQFTPSRVLSNLAQKARKRRQEAGGGSEQADPGVGEERQAEGGGGAQKLLCGLHGDCLALFCTTDETPVCHRCVDSPAHAGHGLSSLKNGAGEYKEKLEEALQPLGTRIKELERREGCQKEKINSMKDMAVSLRANIEARFSELQQLLSQRKEAMLAQVEEDEKNACTDMETRLLQFQEGLRVARELMSQGTTRMAGDNPAAFLLGIRDFLDTLAAEETAQFEEDTDKLPVLCKEFDMGKFKGPPQHLLCRPLCPLFKQGLEPVQLDHRTANPNLSIADAGTRVLVKRCYLKPCNNPERFQAYKAVLGQTGFFSGKYYWEVEYNDMGEWLVGVATESIERKSKLPRGYFGDQIWLIVLPKENNISSEDGVSCYRAGVYLDYEGGQLSFYDVAKGSHLGSYKAKFKEAVYPVFMYAGDSKNEGSLTICRTDMEPPLPS